MPIPKKPRRGAPQARDRKPAVPSKDGFDDDLEFAEEPAGGAPAGADVLDLDDAPAAAPPAHPEHGRGAPAHGARAGLHPAPPERAARKAPAAPGPGAAKPPEKKEARAAPAVPKLAARAPAPEASDADFLDDGEETGLLPDRFDDRLGLRSEGAPVADAPHPPVRAERTPPPPVDRPQAPPAAKPPGRNGAAAPEIPAPPPAAGRSTAAFPPAGPAKEPPAAKDAAPKGSAASGEPAPEASAGPRPLAPPPPPRLIAPPAAPGAPAPEAPPAAAPAEAAPAIEAVEAGVLPDDASLGDIEVMPEPERSASADGTSDAIKSVSRRALPLGSLLVEAGCINNDQLEMALAEQRRTRGLLGDVLVGLGFATEETISEAVGRQTGIAFTRVAREPIAPNLLKLCPEEMCRRHRLVPLGIEGSVLKLGMANPFDVVALDSIRASTGLVPYPSIAPWTDIAAAIEKSFSSIESFDETFEKLIASAEARVGSDEKEAVARGPLVELVDQLILRAVEERATDIHVEPEEMVVRVRYRIDSVLQPGPMIPKKLQTAIAARVKVMAGLNISENRLPQDGRIRFSIKGRQVDLRVSTFLCNFGENIVLRVLDRASVVLSLEKLGLFADDQGKLERLISRPHGIVLVTGPTGSGKTTTLYASLSKLNTIDVNIMTIEDPIEYELTLVRQSQVNVKAGITFASGMRAILRQDPDIVLIGEMRDEETAQMAVRAAMTGHLVFSTLHTNTAVGCIPRLIDMHVEPLLLIDTIIAVIGQRLSRVVCPKCHRRVPCPADRRPELQAAAAKEGIEWDGTVAEPVGCHDCRFRGFHGRNALFEIFEMNSEAQDLILKKHYGAELAAAGRRAGMRTMYDDGVRRVLTHRLTIEELDRVIDNELRDEQKAA